MAQPNLKKVEAQRNRLNAILGNARLRAEKAANRQLVGKCFRYMNTYGVCDGMKRWPLYIHIQRMAADGVLYGLKFEATSRDHIEIDVQHFCGHINEGNGYTEITRAEFDKALDALKATVAKL